MNENHRFDPPGQTPVEKAMSDYLAGKEGWPPNKYEPPEDIPSPFNRSIYRDRDRSHIVTVAAFFVGLVAGFVLCWLQ